MRVAHSRWQCLPPPKRRFCHPSVAFCKASAEMPQQWGLSRPLRQTSVILPPQPQEKRQPPCPKPPRTAGRRDRSGAKSAGAFSCLASERTPYPSPRRKRRVSLILPLFLSPAKPRPWVLPTPLSLHLVPSTGRTLRQAAGSRCCLGGSCGTRGRCGVVVVQINRQRPFL